MNINPLFSITFNSFSERKNDKMLPAKKSPKDDETTITLDSHKNIERKSIESISIFSSLCGIRETIGLKNLRKISIKSNTKKEILQMKRLITQDLQNSNQK